MNRKDRELIAGELVKVAKDLTAARGYSLKVKHSEYGQGFAYYMILRDMINHYKDYMRWWNKEYVTGSNSWFDLEAEDDLDMIQDIRAGQKSTLRMLEQNFNKLKEHETHQWSEIGPGFAIPPKGWD